MTDDDDYTLLDRVQDLGAWLLFLGLPALVDDGCARYGFCQANGDEEQASPFFARVQE